MADPGETLIPGDSPEDERVDAALASAVEEPEADEVEEAVIPFGMTWAFDWEAGRFLRDGSGVPRVYGEDALAQWCLMAIHATRFAHAVFSEAFGVERIDDDLIGAVMASEMAAELEARLRDALLVHDRIVDIEDFTVTYDPSDEMLLIDTFSVVTDEEERVAVAETTLSVGA